MFPNRPFMSTQKSKATRRFQKFILLCVLVVAYPTSAQELSEGQIQTFLNLPPAQQQALARQFGLSPNFISSLSQSASGETRTELTNPVLVRPIDSDINDENTDIVDAQRSTSNIPQQSAISELTPSQIPLTDTTRDDAQYHRNTVKTLSPFGFDVFAGIPTTFAPATDVPVPLEYKLGPGDTLNILLSGQINRTLNVTINRSGMINAPEFGVLSVSGLSFSEASNVIINKIQQKNVGQTAYVTMGELRSVRVFILGEANRPGSYTVSALSTLTNALFVSGGIKESGSLRNIQLKRAGKIVAELDLYDLLIRGDNSNDTRIMAGDVIFIPPVNKTVTVQGEVSREAIFELKNETTIADLQPLFGGYKPTAFLNEIKIERIDGFGARTVKDLNLNYSEDLSYEVKNGDIIKVPSIIGKSNNIITIEGHIYRPGDYAFQNHMKLSDIIQSSEDFLPNIDLDYALIKKQSKFDKSIRFEQFTIAQLLRGEPLAIDANDTVYFFDATKDRRELLSESLTQLTFQGDFTDIINTINVNGAVNFPGTYPYAHNMTVSDALLAAGSLAENATRQFAILLEQDDRENYIPKMLNLEQPDDLNLLLQPQARLFLFTQSGDRTQELEPVLSILSTQSTRETGDYIVSIQGEVKFPGVYPFTNGMTIADLVKSAGGLKPSAYLGLTEISRYAIQDENKLNRQVLSVELATELSSPSLYMKPRDVLTVKPTPGWREEEYVVLEGEFQFPGRYLIQEGETLAEVIARAGGLTELAYPGATLFFRSAIAEQQRVEIDKLNKLLEKQLEISLIKQSSNGLGSLVRNSDTTSFIESIADSNSDGLGRIAIDLSAQLLGMDTPIRLSPNDRIVVPRKPSTVQVIGEVNRTVASVFNEYLELKDYIALAGGATDFADMDDIYIIRADGRIVIPDSAWLSYDNTEIKPGDTIVVPFELNLRDNLSLWQQVTRIIYNSAVSLAAVKGL